MTLDQLVQALSSASADAREILNKIKDIATVNGDVNITFYDGTTITLPGLPKLNSQFQQFMINNENIIKSWWNKAFYVDAENGDDNNPGTQDAPFKTIKKACDSVPIGGYGNIILLSDIIFNYDIFIINKLISILLNGYTLNIAIDSTSRIYGIFCLRGGFVCINGGNTSGSKLILPTRTSDTSGLGIHPTFIKSGFGGSSFHGLSLEYGVTVEVNDTAYGLIETGFSTCSFSVNGTLVDNTGSGLTWADLIKGLIRDTNGVPRNVVSNIVL